MKHSSTVPLVVVVDNFLDDPDKIRAEALSRRYYRNQSSYMRKSYAEVNLEEARRSVQKIGRYIGKRLQKKFVVSHFLLQTKEDERRSEGWVHTDRHQRVGLLCLNTPRQCREGTCFFRHKATGVTRREELAELPVKWIDRIMFKDSTDLSKWELVIRINNIYNRLIIFDPRMFHQASGYFGTTVRSGRLSQTFVFDTVPEPIRLKRKFEKIIKLTNES